MTQRRRHSLAWSVSSHEEPWGNDGHNKDSDHDTVPNTEKGATMHRFTFDSAVRRQRTGRSSVARTASMAAAVAAVGLALSACGSSSATPATTSPAKPASSSQGQGTPRAFPGASGTIAAVTPTSMEVQNASTGQTTVNYTSTTTFRETSTATLAAVTVGSCITANGTPVSSSSSSGPSIDQPLTATRITVTQPTSGSCVSGFGGPGGGGFNRPPGGGSGSGSGGGYGGYGGFGGGYGSGGTRPSGSYPGASGRSFGNFAFTTGQVTAVSGSTVTVQATDPRTQKSTSVAVTVTATTTYTATQAATAAALVVGQCARAVGPASSTGAVTAQSVTVSTPSASGCSSGFRFGGGASGGAPSGGAPGGA